MPHPEEARAAALDAQAAALLAALASPGNAPAIAYGNWTPADSSGAGLVLATASGIYYQLDRLVIACFSLTYPATANGAANQISGLPFQVMAPGEALRQGFVTLQTTGTAFQVFPSGGTQTFNFRSLAGAVLTNAALSGALIYGTLVYTKT